MNKRNGLITFLFLSALILLTLSEATGQTTGRTFDLEPFHARIDLADVAYPRMPEYGALLTHDEFSLIRDRYKSETVEMAIKDDRKQSIFKYQKVRLYLSTMIMDQMNSDVPQPSGDNSGKLDSIKSLSSLILNFRYRDTLESVGRIFEPQIKLGIEF